MALAHLVLAALHEASALMLAAPDGSAEREGARDAAMTLIEGLRVR